VWSEVFPGNTHTLHCLNSAVEATETALELSPEQRKRTVWRLDGGSGADDELRWLLAKGYQILAKGISNRRAEAMATQVGRWDTYQENAWLGEVPPPVNYGRPVRVFIKRRLKDGQFLHSYYVSTLVLPSKGAFLQLYDARGGAEIEQFRNDKDGLSMEARRKHSFLGQKGYILVTDLVHNLLADFHHRVLVGSRFEKYGLKRIVRDLLAVPGRLVFDDAHHLVRVELLSQNLFAEDLAICLLRYISGA
jgi:hypothetical protein